MVKTLKFVFDMILFIFLFLVAKNVVGKLFFSYFSYFLVYFVVRTKYFILFYNNTCFFSLFITESIECRTVADCPKLISSKFVIKCIKKRCVAQFFD